MEPTRWNVEDLPRSGDSRSAPPIRRVFQQPASVLSQKFVT